MNLMLRPKFPWWNWVLKTRKKNPLRNLVMFINDSDFLKVAKIVTVASDIDQNNIGT